MSNKAIRFKVSFLTNTPYPASFLFIFRLFNETIQFLQQINVKNVHVHPVYGAGIRNHDLLNMSRLALPLKTSFIWVVIYYYGGISKALLDRAGALV